MKYDLNKFYCIFFLKNTGERHHRAMAGHEVSPSARVRASTGGSVRAPAQGYAHDLAPSLSSAIYLLAREVECIIPSTGF